MRPAPLPLAKWLADHPKHFRADDARGQLLTAYLTLSAQAAPPRPDSPLGDADLAALAVADAIIKQSPRSEEQAAVAAAGVAASLPPATLHAKPMPPRPRGCASCWRRRCRGHRASPFGWTF